jgi:FkbM family methyltransferase
MLTPLYFENWYSLFRFPSVGIVRKFKLKFSFSTIIDLVWGINIIHDNFFGKQYDWLKCKDKIVVDIGANMGDTAILFTTHGAKKVYAYEPFPYQFDIAKTNIALNGMQDRIELHRVAVDARKGTMRLNSGYSAGNQSIIPVQRGLKTEITTLSTIIDKYHPQILKCDCEGSEYGTILSTPIEELRCFEQIMIEYHKQGSADLEAHLQKAGFKTEVEGYIKKWNCGIIKASKAGQA